MARGTWISTDERSEAVRALRKFRQELSAVRRDAYEWKWALWVLHNAVQSVIVASISGTAGLGALSEKAIKAWMKAYDSDSPRPADPYLAVFLELYGRVKEQVGFNPTAEVDRDVMLLNEYRNSFMHFTPKSWSIEVSGFPRLCRNCLTVIAFLWWQPGHVPWYFESHVESARQEHELILRDLDEIDALYAEGPTPDVM